MSTADLNLIWSHQHNAWWAPTGRGHTRVQAATVRTINRRVEHAEQVEGATRA